MLALLTVAPLSLFTTPIPIEDGPGEAVTIREPYCVEAIRRLGTYDALDRDRLAQRDLAEARGSLIENLMRENVALSNSCATLAQVAAQEGLAASSRMKRERIIWASAAGAAFVIGIILKTVLSGR